MNTVGIYAGYFLDAFSVAFAPHKQSRRSFPNQVMPSLAARAQAEAKPRAMKSAKVSYKSDNRLSA